MTDFNMAQAWYGLGAGLRQRSKEREFEKKYGMSREDWEIKAQMDKRADDMAKWRFNKGVTSLTMALPVLDKLKKTGTPEQIENFTAGMNADFTNQGMEGYGLSRLLNFYKIANLEGRKNFRATMKAVGEKSDAGDWEGVKAELLKGKGLIADKEWNNVIDGYLKNIEGKEEREQKMQDFELKEALKHQYSVATHRAGLEAGKPTSDIKEYNYAKTQGYTGSFNDWQIKQKKAGATNINLGQEGLQKPVVTELQKNIIKASGQIETLNEIEQSFKPEFLTWAGKGEKFIRRQMDKAGVATGEQKQETYAYQDWYAPAKQSFLEYRKWITGVAGGEKEMKEIAKSYPDPDRNSPTEYKANLKRTREIIRKIQNVQKTFLEEGITKPTKRQVLDAAFGKKKGFKKMSDKPSALSPKATDFIRKYGAEK